MRGRGFARGKLVLSGVLALGLAAFLATPLPIAAAAAEGGTEAASASLEAASSEPIVGTGYSFDPDTGTLTVTENDGTAAWQGDFGADAIKEIVVESGVTRIEGAAFHSCANLVQVTLPDGLTEIGTSAFADCTSLAAIAFPSSLTTIGDFAFDGCTGLVEVTLPGNLEEVGSFAFSDCTGLTTATFLGTVAPSVPNTDYDMFDGCTSLVAIYVPKGATGYDEGNWAQYSSKVFYGASLESLLVSEGTLDPVFSAETYEYSVTVDSDVKAITLTPTAQASETIAVNGTSVTSGSAYEVALGDGTTEIQIVVKGGSLTATYAVAVTVAQPETPESQDEGDDDAAAEAADVAADDDSTGDASASAPKASTAAKTGDEGHAAPWVVLAGVSGIALLVARILARRRGLTPEN